MLYLYVNLFFSMNPQVPCIYHLCVVYVYFHSIYHQIYPEKQMPPLGIYNMPHPVQPAFRFPNSHC